MLLDFLCMWYCCIDIFVGLYQRETSHHEVSSNGGHQRGTKERQRSRNEEACPQIHADSKRSVCVQTLFVKYGVDDMFLCHVVAYKKLTLYEHQFEIFTQLCTWLKYSFKYLHCVFTINCFSMIQVNKGTGVHIQCSSKLQNKSWYHSFSVEMIMLRMIVDFKNWILILSLVLFTKNDFVRHWRNHY